MLLTTSTGKLSYKQKNGDAPGPLGNFVICLVTERNTGKKENETKKHFKF